MLCQKRILISDTWSGFGHFTLCPQNNIMLEVIKWPYIFLPNLKPVFMQRGDWSLEAPQGRLETSWGDWGSGFLATRGTIVSVRRRNIWAILFGSRRLKCIYHTESAENLIMNMGTLYDTVLAGDIEVVYISQVEVTFQNVAYVWIFFMGCRLFKNLAF